MYRRVITKNVSGQCLDGGDVPAVDCALEELEAKHTALEALKPELGRLQSLEKLLNNQKEGYIYGQ